jgi:hypothetical protein
MPQSEVLYYITSPHGDGGIAVTGNCVQFWRVDGHGYTCNLDEAWKLPREKALEVVRGKRGDRAYRVDEVDAIAARHVDFQLLRDIKGVTSA